MTAAEKEIIVNTAKEQLDAVITEANRIILGKEKVIRLAITCLIAKGHLLIEDMPGVGKTTLAHMLAQLLGLSFQRIQFTSDLLPADILGVSIYKQETGTFIYQAGPIFSQVILADEVNRATPRTQSALLEAMEEHQVTVEGETRPLPTPFFVIATQNPSSQVGTFPLPESQLDRFMMRLELGYPDNSAERDLLKGRDRRELLAEMPPVLSAQDLQEIQAKIDSVYISDALLDYLQNLLEYSRITDEYSSGLSPRAGLAILRCSQAWALMHGHEQVLPEDIQAVLPSIISHRLPVSTDQGNPSQHSAAELLLKNVPVP